ncbi:recombinase zinc ribbon domain-containing protein [Catellatospora paridis]|uniref:zinc ribbon domain-containing protein n=1 Tax=Catellatospora paridis TaxID=1617086 RepID=UPI0012D40613|nr:zinc ribbon domain-containing protein [Catellatospora paridis]
MTSVRPATTGQPTRQPVSFQQLLHCAWCSGPMAAMHAADGTRGYQCPPRCSRKNPVNADWLERQVLDALHHRVPLADTPSVLQAITVGAVQPGQIRLTWRVPHLTIVQPQDRPTVRFVPARNPQRSTP